MKLYKTDKKKCLNKQNARQLQSNGYSTRLPISPAELCKYWNWTMTGPTKWEPNSKKKNKKREHNIDIHILYGWDHFVVFMNSLWIETDNRVDGQTKIRSACHGNWKRTHRKKEIQLDTSTLKTVHSNASWSLTAVGTSNDGMPTRTFVIDSFFSVLLCFHQHIPFNAS